MPRGARYTIGARIEERFLDLLELVYIAYFSDKTQKLTKVSACILALDTLKFLLTIAWEGKLISNAHYQALGPDLIEAGRMLGGWKKNAETPDKKNRTL